jgi:hypothetical protein
MNDFCPHCGDPIPDWATVCPFCGSATANPIKAIRCHPGTAVQPSYIVPLESAPQSRYANFEVLEEDGPEAILECPCCGWQFAVNAYTGENMAFDSQNKTVRETCPLCGTIQE